MVGKGDNFFLLFPSLFSTLCYYKQLPIIPLTDSVLLCIETQILEENIE